MLPGRRRGDCACTRQAEVKEGFGAGGSTVSARMRQMHSVGADALPLLIALCSTF
jgi:hypothetical protein